MLPDTAAGRRGPAPSAPDEDHVDGPADATHVLLIYGDYECPYTRAAHLAVRGLRRAVERWEARHGRAASATFRYAYRHFPLRELHPHAQATRRLHVRHVRGGDGGLCHRGRRVADHAHGVRGVGGVGRHGPHVVPAPVLVGDLEGGGGQEVPGRAAVRVAGGAQHGQAAVLNCCRTF